MPAWMACGVAGTRLDDAERAALESIRPGGVVLFRRNVRTREELVELVGELRELPSRPYVAIDLEGGRVNRLEPLIGALPPAAVAVRAARPRSRPWGPRSAPPVPTSGSASTTHPCSTWPATAATSAARTAASAARQARLPPRRECAWPRSNGPASRGASSTTRAWGAGWSTRTCSSPSSATRCATSAPRSISCAVPVAP